MDGSTLRALRAPIQPGRVGPYVARLALDQTLPRWQDGGFEPTCRRCCIAAADQQQAALRPPCCCSRRPRRARGRERSAPARRPPAPPPLLPLLRLTATPWPLPLPLPRPPARGGSSSCRLGPRPRAMFCFSLNCDTKYTAPMHWRQLALCCPGSRFGAALPRPRAP
jgi:hypothetical protein